MIIVLPFTVVDSDCSGADYQSSARVDCSAILNEAFVKVQQTRQQLIRVSNDFTATSTDIQLCITAYQKAIEEEKKQRSKL